MPFTRMDQGRVEDWMVIGDAISQRQAGMPERVKAMLANLEEQIDGFAVNQLEHSLQTATRALRAGASEELIVASLCHDIGKAISPANHAGISAEILKPYVSPDTYEIIRTHQDFQGRHYYAFLGKDPESRSRYVNEPWYGQACEFTDEWDQVAFDAEYDSLPLSHFEPMIDRLFSQMRSGSAQSADNSSYAS